MLVSKVSPVFKARRQRILTAHPDSVFIFPANSEPLRNPDVHYPFRQNSDLHYLSAFPEPESALVLAQGKTILFVRQRNPEMEMWEGERFGTDRAVQVFGADLAYPIDEFGVKLGELLRGADKLFYRLNHHEENDAIIFGALEKARKSQGRSGRGLLPIHDPIEIVGEMRLFKDAEEIDLMRKVAKLSAQAHTTIMREVKPGMNEAEVCALLDYTFLKNGAHRLGYPSIVAGGKNAACLHYRSNNEVLRDGEMLLIDAGAELDLYGADITRTFPIGRKFSAIQAQCYDLVLKAQLEAIALAKPGSHQPAIHRRACEVLIEGMLSLGLLKGKPEEIYKDLSYKRFYPHNTGHWLGMDVHDVGLYQKNGEPRLLEPGMVFTIEPGFYIQPEDTQLPSGFGCLGIRIEDDILITSSGCEVLTRDVPKGRAEIEALRA